MTVIIIISIIIIVIVFKFFNDRDKILQKQVDSHGGMKLKYKVLIDGLSQGATPQFCEITRDHIHFRFIGNPTIINYYITEYFGDKVNVEWIMQMGFLGNRELKWEFQNLISQEEMAEKIAMDISDAMDKFYNQIK